MANNPVFNIGFNRGRAYGHKVTLEKAAYLFTFILDDPDITGYRLAKVAKVKEETAYRYLRAVQAAIAYRAEPTEPPSV